MIGNPERLATQLNYNGQGGQSPAPFEPGVDQEFYRIFSRIFHMPDLAFAKYVRSDLLADIHFLGDDAVAGFRQFLDEHAQKDDESFFYTLAVEYTRLFVAGVPCVPCPPYESLYRENTVMGASTQAVLTRYKEAGLKVLDNFHDLPDHVAVELEFLYYLLAKGDREGHDSFVQEHLSEWVQPFSQAVGQSSKIAFYRHAAVVLAQTIIDHTARADGQPN